MVLKEQNGQISSEELIKFLSQKNFFVKASSYHIEIYGKTNTEDIFWSNGIRPTDLVQMKEIPLDNICITFTYGCNEYAAWPSQIRAKAVWLLSRQSKLPPRILRLFGKAARRRRTTQALDYDISSIEDIVRLF